MKTIYRVRVPRGFIGQPKVRSEPSHSAPELPGLDVVFAVLDSDDPENAAADGEWAFVDIRIDRTIGGTKGWIESRFLGEVVDAAPMTEIDMGLFVRTCARHEMKYATGRGASGPEAPANEAPAIAVLADYLIGVAEIETGITGYELSPGPDDLLGPFQHSREEWDEFLAANPHLPFNELSRFNAIRHVSCAAYLAERDWEAFAKLAEEAGLVVDGEPYIPSFLSLLHSRFLGVDTAFKLLLEMNGGGQDKRILELLKEFVPEDLERETLIDRRERFLMPPQTGKATTVMTFFEHTRGALNDAFRKATSLLETHFPEFVVVPESVAAPWVGKAEDEETLWQGRDEDSPEGQERIREYFNKSTDHPKVHGTPPAWCGAFVAHMLATSGDARAKASVVRGSARAANWKVWGDRELRHGQLASMTEESIRGAIVVLHAPPDGSSSGHVTIAVGKVPNKDDLLCLGGNQDDTVKLKAFGFSRIAAVRVLMNDTRVPSGNDADTLARTLFGEARGESREGRMAVANVVMNRVNHPRYPETVTGVCRQKAQFSCWNGNDPNLPKVLAVKPGDNAEFDDCIAVANEAIAGRIDVLPTDTLHYHADWIAAPSWVRNSRRPEVVARIGHHIFYTGID